jgi:sialate O-acetylesterase
MNAHSAATALILVAAAVAANPSGRSAPNPVTLHALDSLRLPPLFTDGMVLQRDKPVVLWGWAAPKARVTVRLADKSGRATASTDGSWTVTLPPNAAGGPFILSVQAGDVRRDVHDVLFGDVWLASGQSNMEWEVALSNNANAEIAAAHDSLIRQFKIPISWSNEPERELVGGTWTPADPAHVGRFTAVGYFFARELRKSVPVPIGIINSTWGGSAIETWMSRRAQHLGDSAWAALLRDDEQRHAAIRENLRAKIGELPERDAGLTESGAPWAARDLNDDAWAAMPVPAYWEGNGYDGMDGIAWYRLAFDVDSAHAANGAMLEMSAIDDDDITWLNSTEIGHTNGYNLRRAYRIPNETLRPGRNLLAVRVSDGGGGGGINGSVSLRFADGTTRSLAGQWKFKVGAVAFLGDGQRLNKIPTITYNRMIHPMLPLAIKGVLWYQGESNANNVQQAKTYRGQLQSLITSWRAEFSSARGAFPFFWIQLPNYNRPDSTPPAEAGWATIRESMEAALALPNTGQVVTIDLGGVPAELHPRNKQDVGARLARVVRKVAYRQNVIASGPTYRSHTLRGDTVVVTFGNIGAGLRARGNSLGGFAVAGADRRWVWANAKIYRSGGGSRVLVWSAAVKQPVAVRYAWADNPEHANLYNSEGLPAAPFRTDAW